MCIDFRLFISTFNEMTLILLWACILAITIVIIIIIISGIIIIGKYLITGSLNKTQWKQ